jgi:hypothetical protein
MLNKLFFQIIIFFVSLSSLLISQSQKDISVTIVHSEKTKQLIYKENNLFNPIYDWELFFLNNKFSYDVIDDDGLNNFDFIDTDVLILPSVEVLSDESAKNIKEYLKHGGGIFIIGQLGLYDESGGVRMNSILEDIFDITFNKLPIKKISSSVLEVEPSNLLSRSTNFNSDLLVLNRLTNYYCQNRTSEIRTLAKYKIHNVSEVVNDYPAIISGEKGNGKLIWFGFQLSQLSASSNLDLFKNVLVFNSIDWLADKSVVWVNKFPNIYESASLLIFEINDLKNFNDEILLLIHNKKIECIFFLNPELIINHFGYLSPLSVDGEISVLVDGQKMKNKSESFITNKLNEAYRILKGETDQNTFGLFFKNGNSFYTSINSNINFDFYVDQDYKILFKSASDKEENIYNKINYSLIDLTKYDFEEETKSVSEYLDTGFISSDIINILLPSKNDIRSNLSISDLLNEYISVASLKNFWLTNYSRIIDWIDKKENLDVKIEETENDEIFKIKLTNNNDQVVENIGLSLIPPSSNKNPEQINYSYQIRYDKKTGLYKLLIPSIKSHQTLIIDMQYDY